MDTAAGDMEDYTVAEWILSDERQAGDITLVESYDESSNHRSLIALYFLAAHRNDQKTYAFQEILLVPQAICPGDETQYWGIKQDLELLCSDKNEDAFSALAEVFSALSSGENLGYRTVDADTLSGEPYAAWVTDGDRAPGDIETFEADNGIYLIRYVGEGSVHWESNAKEALCAQWQREQKEGLLQTTPIRTNLFYVLIN